jgi:hypothetical protein
MGPQFSFGVYSPPTSQYESAELFNPNDQPSGSVITAQKCCPVLIEKSSSHGIANSASLNNATRIS